MRCIITQVLSKTQDKIEKQVRNEAWLIYNKVENQLNFEGHQVDSNIGEQIYDQIRASMRRSKRR